MSNRGHQRERDFVHRLREQGFWAQRAPASLGIDVIAAAASLEHENTPRLQVESASTNTQLGRHRASGPPLAQEAIAPMQHSPYDLCQCGCGQDVRPGSRFRQGHSSKGRRRPNNNQTNRPVQSAKGSRLRLTDHERARALEMWDAGKSRAAIGRELDCSHITVTRCLIEAGITPEWRAPTAREHHSWRGGRYVDAERYVQVRVHPDDPMATMRNSKGSVMEHRLVVARHLGRPLTRDETVHHINGDRQDNRPENLQLRVKDHGSGQAWRCADCGSVNIKAEPIR